MFLLLLTDSETLSVLKEIMALFPDAGPSLNFNSVYQLLIAVMLSAQSTDKKVNEVTPDLFKAFPTPKHLAEASPQVIEPYINQLGLYHSKARYLHAMGQQLIDKYGGQVPNQRRDLESLSGVGRKTASVVLSLGFDQPAFAVDTHITRIAKNHRFVDPNATVREVEKRITRVLPASEWKDAHHALIAFGRTICTARNPQCYRYPQLFPHQGKETKRND